MVSPFHSGGGLGEDATTSYLVRDAQGNPIWPGSSFKGKVRHYAQAILSEVRGSNCASDENSKIDEQEVHCDCIICDMLGGTGNARGNLLFSDLRLNDLALEPSVMRAGNAINRKLRTAKDTGLFEVEAAGGHSGTVLSGEIHGTLRDEGSDDQRKLLTAAIKSIPFIGGNTSRGLGWVDDIVVTDIQDETTVPSDRDNSNDANDVGKAPIAKTHQRVILTVRSPLLIGKHSTRSNYRRTQYLVPGALMRAALASEIATRDGSSSKEYLNFVTKDGGNGAFPSLRASFGDLNISQFLPIGCRIPPITARQCKHGFKTEMRVYDTLVSYLSGIISFRCPQCRGRLERAQGFCDSDGYAQKRPPTEIMTKSAINRYRGTSRDEMLYSFEVIAPSVEPPIEFEGMVSGYFDPEELKRLVDGGLRIGGRISTGLGQMEVAVKDNELSEDSIDTMRERIRVFNSLLPSRTETLIPITLLSEARVVLLEPVGKENSDYLRAFKESLFHGLGESVELVQAIAQHGQWRGFDTKRKTYFLKDAVHIIKAGAVFVLSCSEMSDDLLKMLLEKQRKGICAGVDNQKNGFGQICVADEFHVANAIPKEDKSYD
jgi:CRISPR-associated Csx10 family RAMP protein